MAKIRLNIDSISFSTNFFPFKLCSLFFLFSQILFQFLFLLLFSSDATLTHVCDRNFNRIICVDCDIRQAQQNFFFNGSFCLFAQQR